MDSRSFDSKRIALGYAKRPWLHKEVIERVKRDCGFEPGYTFKNGLDVGCGAGLSTKALRLICDRVTGTDVAEAMIEVCRELYRNEASCHFYTAKAEETQIPDDKYDIVTAAGCINWVDEKQFLANMDEVLCDNGLLVIYDFGITDRMIGDTGRYKKWYREDYLYRFPKPQRKERKWTQDEMPTGFVMEKQTEYEIRYAFDLNRFVEFMLIQSNVNAQIENGSITPYEAEQWMLDGLSDLFGEGERELVFSGYSWYIRKRGKV
ncbi:MAG: methyltransferase domain-containing protein [Lachnospiraceae bacterium]|nr:methyltransferase domain-containing protein [Lachnospiraceae bacterium]